MPPPYPAWQPSTAYQIMTRVTCNGAVFECMLNGTSAAASWAPGTVYRHGQVVDSDSVLWYTSSEGVSGTVGPKRSDAGALEPVVDGTCRWFHVNGSYADALSPPQRHAGPYPGTIPMPVHHDHWRANFEYKLGQHVDSQGEIWRCVVAGKTSPVSMPTPPQSAGPDLQTDGAVQWLRVWPIDTLQTDGSVLWSQVTT